jgi:hypothetical protein
MRCAMDRRAHPQAASPLPRARTAAAARYVGIVGLIVLLIGIGVAAAAAWSSSLLGFVAACSVALVVVAVVWTSREDVVLRRFRRQLAALPETAHPHGY